MCQTKRGEPNPLTKLRYFSFSKYGKPPLNTKPRDASICNGRDPETKTITSARDLTGNRYQTKVKGK